MKKTIIFMITIFFSGIVFSACTTPTNGMNISADTNFCRGTYNFVGVALGGAINITASGVAGNYLTLDCNGSTFIGNDGNFGLYSNTRNYLEIKNCTFIDYSRGFYPYAGSNILVTDSNFSNTGTKANTGLWFERASATTSNITLTRVTAENLGSAMHFRTPTSGSNTTYSFFKAVDSNFSDNNYGISVSSAGARVIFQDLNLKNNQFRNSTLIALQLGYLDSTNNLRNYVYNDNNLDGSGNGIYSTGGLQLKDYNLNSFNIPYANYLVYIYGGDSNISGCRFDGNYFSPVTISGASNSNTIIQDSNFSKTGAKEGNGLYFATASTLSAIQILRIVSENRTSGINFYNTASGTNLTLSNIKIQDSNLNDNDYGINSTSFSSARVIFVDANIKNNQLKNNSVWAISLGYSNSANNLRNYVYNDNNLDGSGNGIFSTGGLQLSDYSLSSFNIAGTLVWLYGGNDSIVNCRFDGNYTNPLYIQGPAISNVLLQDLNLTKTGAKDGNGIIIDSTSTYTDFNFIRLHLENWDNAIIFRNFPSTSSTFNRFLFQDSNFFNNTIGIYELKNSAFGNTLSNSNILHNTFSNNSSSAILFSGITSTNNALNGNSFINTAPNLSASFADANYNYWSDWNGASCACNWKVCANPRSFTSAVDNFPICNEIVDCSPAINTDWNISTDVTCVSQDLNIGSGNLGLLTNGFFTLIDSSIINKNLLINRTGNSVFLLASQLKQRGV